MKSNILTMEKICEKDNIRKALISCKGKKTSPGVDNMRAEELSLFWDEYEGYIVKQLLKGQYYPMPARKGYVHKPGKTQKRVIAVLTMLDKMIQKAVNNIMQEYYEASFHDCSYGYRKNRTPDDALNKVLNLLKEGNKYVVSIDIEKYFDNINHKLLINKLRKQIDDNRIILLLERYMKQKIVSNGKEYRKGKGVIQGAPISPLLANIYLDIFDWYMAERNVDFVRFADDILLLAKNKEEAEWVMKEAKNFLENKLMLRINVNKSKISKPESCVFLGYEIVKLKNGIYGVEVCQKNKEKMVNKLYALINNMSGYEKSEWDRIGAFHRGWVNYFCLSSRTRFKSFLRNVQKEEMLLFRQKITEVQMEDNRLLKDAFLNSKGFVLFTDWLTVIERRKQGKYG